MEAAGYDRDFDEVIAAARAASRPTAACGRWREVELRPGAVRLPPDVGLDLGGVAKGWTADLAAERALEGLPWVLVSAGGDLRIAGDAPELGDHDRGPGRGRSLAGRAATANGRDRDLVHSAAVVGPGLHHVIDPRSGAPSATGVDQATVWLRPARKRRSPPRWRCSKDPKEPSPGHACSWPRTAP